MLINWGNLGLGDHLTYFWDIYVYFLFDTDPGSSWLFWVLRLYLTLYFSLFGTPGISRNCTVEAQFLFGYLRHLMKPNHRYCKHFFIYHLILFQLSWIKKSGFCSFQLRQTGSRIQGLLEWGREILKNCQYKVVSDYLSDHAGVTFGSVPGIPKWRHLSGLCWWLIWAPPGGMVAMTYPDHPPKYQPNRPTDSWERAPFYTLVAPPGGWVIDRSRWQTHPLRYSFSRYIDKYYMLH